MEQLQKRLLLIQKDSILHPTVILDILRGSPGQL